jgi:hypothetical protein
VICTSFASSCFPHVTNIATKAGLKHMTKLPDDDKEIEDPSLIGEAFPRFAYDADFAYREALEKDIVAAARKLVNACRASGQCREALENVIVEGNEKKWFKDEHGQAYSLEILVLLRDVDTRWSSILYMIDRLIVNYPVCAMLGYILYFC